MYSDSAKVFAWRRPNAFKRLHSRSLLSPSCFKQMQRLTVLQSIKRALNCYYRFYPSHCSLKPKAQLNPSVWTAVSLQLCPVDVIQTRITQLENEQVDICIYSVFTPVHWRNRNWCFMSNCTCDATSGTKRICITWDKVGLYIPLAR